MAIITWDTVNKGLDVILSNGNLTAVTPNSSNTTRASEGKTTGKWYWEVKVDENIPSNTMIGLVNTSASLISPSYNTSNARYYWSSSGRKYPGIIDYGESFAVGDIIGIALDLINGALEFYKNGVSQGIAFTDVDTMGEVFPAVTSGGATSITVSANFGATPFKYPMPDEHRSYDWGGRCA